VTPWIASTFELSRVRVRSLVRAAAFFLLFNASVTALKSATNALFLVRCDPTDLPYLYLATALAVTLATAYIGKHLASFGARPILRLALFASTLLLVVLSALAAIDFRPALAVLYVTGEVFATAISVLFWARLGETFDVRTAKRIFGAVSAAGMVGAVVGGILVRGLQSVIPAVGWCVFALACVPAMVLVIGKDRGKTAIHTRKISFSTGLVYAIVERFPRGVALFVLLTAVQTAAVDYVFRTGAVALFDGRSEAALTGMFGVLNAVVGIGAILVQSLLTALLLRNVGVFAFLAIVPLACIVAAIWSAFAPRVFLPLFLLKAIEMMGSISLNQPALQLLYNPMPQTVRDSVRALVDGAVKKLGGAAGGVLLLLFGSLLAERQLLGLVVVIAALLLAWIRRLRPAYLAALEAKLGARGQSVLAPIDPSDRSTKDQLLRALSSDDAGKVLAALSVLEHDPAFVVKPHVDALIAHADETVRLRAIELITKAPDPSYAPLLVAIIQNDTRRPKAQAARALDLVDREMSKKVLEPILEAPAGAHDLGLVCAAIAALLPLDGSSTVPRSDSAVWAEISEDEDEKKTPAERALIRLLQRGRSGTPAERREIARLLGLLGKGPHARQLAVYLDDPEPSVRILAVKSAAIALDPSLPPKLIPRLHDRAIRRVVREALAAYGEDLIPLLQETLDDRRVPVHVRVHVPRILRQIGTARAAEAMLFSNVQDDAFLRYVIVEELNRMRRIDPKLAFDEERVEEAALRRLRAYTHYRPIAKDLAAAPSPFALLRRAIDDRVRQNLEAALRLLGLVYALDAMEHALRGFLKDDPNARADALELIDVSLQGSEMRAQVLSTLEVGSQTAPPIAAFDHDDHHRLAHERASALVESRDMQLAMIAWETLRRVGQDPPDVREPSVGEPLMPKSIIDRLFLLEGVQLFHGLSVDDLAAVAALTTEGHADPGEVIYREGDPGDSMGVITSGEVHLVRGQQSLMDLGVGDSFGETSILDRGPRPVTARAGDEGVDFLVLERAPFMDLIADRPPIVHGLFVVLGRRLRQLLDLTGDGVTSAASPGPTRGFRPDERGS
jgi:hypothetical protein